MPDEILFAAMTPDSPNQIPAKSIGAQFLPHPGSVDIGAQFLPHPGSADFEKCFHLRQPLGQGPQSILVEKVPIYSKLLIEQYEFLQSKDCHPKLPLEWLTTLLYQKYPQQILD